MLRSERWYEVGFERAERRAGGDIYIQDMSCCCTERKREHSSKGVHGLSLVCADYWEIVKHCPNIVHGGKQKRSFVSKLVCL
jgi:hypothetical protein